MGGSLQRDNLYIVPTWNRITGLPIFRSFSTKERLLFQVILDCQSDPFNKCHCLHSHSGFYDISATVNVETSSDLKIVQVILIFSYPEYILFVRHGADSRYYQVFGEDSSFSLCMYFFSLMMKKNTFLHFSMIN